MIKTLQQRITEICGGADLNSMHQWLSQHGWPYQLSNGSITRPSVDCCGNSRAIVWPPEQIFDGQPLFILGGHVAKESERPEEALAIAIIDSLERFRPRGGDSK